MRHKVIPHLELSDIAARALVFVLIVVAISSCQGIQGEVETIRVGVPPLEQNALLYQLPDFRDHVYVDGLTAVKPGAVNIVR